MILDLELNIRARPTLFFFDGFINKVQFRLIIKLAFHHLDALPLVMLYCYAKLKAKLFENLIETHRI